MSDVLQITHFVFSNAIFFVVYEHMNIGKLYHDRQNIEADV